MQIIKSTVISKEQAKNLIDLFDDSVQIIVKGHQTNSDTEKLNEYLNSKENVIAKYEFNEETSFFDSAL